MKQIKINDKIDVIVSELNDTIETTFDRNGKILHPLSNEDVYVWVNGVNLDIHSKEDIIGNAKCDNVPPEEEWGYIVKDFEECKNIYGVLDVCEVYSYNVSENPYDLIDDYKMTESVYTQDEIEALYKLDVDDLKAELKKYIYATFVDLGTYVAFMYD